MIELELLGPSADGQSIVFTDSGGNRYEVLIDDKLRTVVRRDPNAQETSPLPDRQKLRPSDIQSLLRQGRGAHEIAALYDLEVEDVRRFESPIAAEKAWAVSQAQRAPVGADPSTPRLEELVINRLATRGVEQTSLQWSAQKQPSKNWEVSVSFIQSAVERVATWRLVGDGPQIEAIDQEAHWLTESATPFQSVRALFGDVASEDTDADSEDDVEETDRLLDQLNAQRGKRQPIMDYFDGDDGDEGDSEDGGFADAVDSTSSLPYFSARMAAAPGLSKAERRKQEQDTVPIPFPPPSLVGHSPTVTVDEVALVEEDEETEPLFDTPKNESRPPKIRKKGKRASVPSWDEIVFGARSD